VESAQPPEPAKKVTGGFQQVVELTVGGPGQSVYWQHEVNRAALAATEEVPFKITVVEPKAPLVQNGSMNLKVVAERKGNFQEPISIEMVFNPPGVSSAGGVSIPGGKNEAAILLNANNGAMVREWKTAVAGVAGVKNGPVWISSQLFTLRIAPPYLAVQMQGSSVEQGQETEIFCKVEQRTPFEGPGKVTLLGLPARVTAPPVEITKETREFAFHLKVDQNSPPGRHRNLFCQLEITEKGEPVVHRAGSSELRIDRPLPPPKNEPPPKPKPVVKKPGETKPKKRILTRLEKLRLEYQERGRGKEK